MNLAGQLSAISFSICEMFHSNTERETLTFLESVGISINKDFQTLCFAYLKFRVVACFFNYFHSKFLNQIQL